MRHGYLEVGLAYPPSEMMPLAYSVSISLASPERDCVRFETTWDIYPIVDGEAMVQYKEQVDIPALIPLFNPFVSLNAFVFGV